MWNEFVQWLMKELDTPDMSHAWDWLNRTSNALLISKFCAFLDYKKDHPNG